MFTEIMIVFISYKKFSDELRVIIQFNVDRLKPLPVICANMNINMDRSNNIAYRHTEHIIVN